MQERKGSGAEGWATIRAHGLLCSSKLPRDPAAPKQEQRMHAVALTSGFASAEWTSRAKKK